MVKRFSVADLAQQMVGGFLFAGPFIVTEEVWRLAKNMTPFHSLITVVIVLIIGFGALYTADVGRDMNKERELGGIPLRLISLVFVSYSSVTLLTFVLNAPVTFEATNITIMKTICIASIFSLIGAATADTIFQKS